jgi:predicted nucleic acid-binding protein
MSGYIADTSVFIAAEQRRPLGQPPPGEARISVATLTELGVGLLRSKGNDDLYRLRRTTLARAHRFIALPYDEAVSDRMVEILANARRTGRRAGAMDAIIAATAVAHRLTVWTQDEDFEVLRELAPRLYVQRG